MMSILLLTLLSWLHCHPGVMFRVSLLPVANVVLSPVQKVVDVVFVSEHLSVALTFTPKSRTKSPFVNPTVAVGSIVEVFVPLALNRLFQSRVCVEQSGTVPHVTLVSPSSWKLRSWTA